MGVDLPRDQPGSIIWAIRVALVNIYPSRLDDLISVLQRKSSRYLLPYTLVMNIFDLKTPGDFNSFRIQVAS